MAGGGVYREAPRGSPAWHTFLDHPTGGGDLCWRRGYATCCLGAARCSHLHVLHNMQEVRAWPPLECAHTHEALEWGKTGAVYHEALAEESSVTAARAFWIASAASWWAGRKGLAPLYLPRPPPADPAGDRRAWLACDPRALREWALAPIAVACGVRPGGGSTLMPSRASAESLQLRTHQGAPALLPAGHHYVGQGSHVHRLRRSAWASPFLQGIDGNSDECAGLYAKYIRDPGFAPGADHLAGCTLVCDCPAGRACEADEIVGLALELGLRGAPQAVARARGGPRLLPARGGEESPPPVVRRRWPQEVVVGAFRRLFPASVFDGFRFPMVEDLLGGEPFTGFADWKRQRGERDDVALGPRILTTREIRAGRAGMGQQQGAVTHKAALPPLLSHQLGPGEHFLEARRVAASPSPLERDPAGDEDIRYAAERICAPAAALAAARLEHLAALEELRDRWRPVTARIRAAQCPTVAAVTKDRDLGLLALAVVLLAWPDTTLPLNLLYGLPAVGFAPWCRVFGPQPVQPVDPESAFDDWQKHNENLRASVRPSPHAGFILEKSLEDVGAGWAKEPVNRQELEIKLRGRPYRLIQRHVVVQGNGKKRLIDDANKGGQTERSADASKLRLCSALQPAAHLRALRSAYRALGEPAVPGGPLHTGGEDWPNAYRWTPMRPDDALACVVTFWHPQRQELVYMIYAGFIFGLPLAVTGFNRYPKLVEAIARRWLWLLMSMYFDDATLQEWAATAEGAQDALRRLGSILGTPFAAEKTQAMAPTGTFLGLDHDVGQAWDSGAVTFWAKKELEDKVRMDVTAARVSRLPPGVAAKIYGRVNFLESGTFGRIGRAGLQALKERQYEGASSLTPALSKALAHVLEVLSLRPQREVYLAARAVPRFLGASDAAWEGGKGSGGFLVVNSPGAESETRTGRAVAMGRDVYDKWGYYHTYIAQLELLMVLAAVIFEPELRGRQGVWFIDNVAALMALIKGSSDNADLDSLTGQIHGALFARGIGMYFEWVESKANWSDGISREGLRDEWHRANGFKAAWCTMPSLIPGLPLRPTVRTFELLP